jgi:hypothetical protein
MDEKAIGSTADCAVPYPAHPAPSVATMTTATSVNITTSSRSLPRGTGASYR